MSGTVVALSWVVQTIMKNKRGFLKTRKARIVILSIAIVLIAVISFGFWFWTTNKNAIIENEIEKAITKTQDKFYRISYDDMKIDETTGSLSMVNLKLSYDSAKYRTDAEQGKAPSMLFNIEIPEISVVGVKTRKALLDKEIVGRRLEIKNPVVNLQYTYKGKDSIRNVPTEDIYRELLRNLDLIWIDTVLITDARVRTINKNTGKTMIDISNIDLSLIDLKVDSISYKDSARYLFSKQMNVNIAQISWPSPDKLYKYTAKNISLRSSSRNLSVDRVSMLPALGENEFVNAIPTQQDRFNLSFNNIIFSGLDIDRLFNEYIEATTMTISNSTVKIYRDLARPRDKKNRVGQYPHQVLDDFPVRFNIHKVNVRNSFVEYKERSHITRQSGKVQFHNVDGVITNFTNDKKVKNKVMKAFVNSSFLNRTSLKTNWTFYLFDPQGRFDVSGAVGAIDGGSLNQLAEPMGPATIKQGQLNKLTFDMKGNNHSMNGNVTMLYNDLKVALLEKDKGEVELDKKFLGSLVANFVIKNSNPKDDDDDVRVEQVHLVRNTNRSLFNLCWKTIFKGIQGTVGIKQATAAK